MILPEILRLCICNICTISSGLENLGHRPIFLNRIKACKVKVFFWFLFGSIFFCRSPCPTISESYGTVRKIQWECGMQMQTYHTTYTYLLVSLADFRLFDLGLRVKPENLSEEINRDIQLTQFRVQEKAWFKLPVAPFKSRALCSLCIKLGNLSLM